MIALGRDKYRLGSNEGPDYLFFCRLLKGAAPGRKQVNYYASEIGVLKNNKLFSERCQYNHLMDVLDGRFGLSQNHSGMGGITADQKFYDPEKVKDYTGSIRFKDPQRTVPVLA